MGLIKAVIIFAIACISTIILHDNLDKYKDKPYIKPIYPWLTKCNTLVLITFFILILI